MTRHPTLLIQGTGKLPSTQLTVLKKSICSAVYWLECQQNRKSIYFEGEILSAKPSSLSKKCYFQNMRFYSIYSESSH